MMNKKRILLLFFFLLIFSAVCVNGQESEILCSTNAIQENKTSVIIKTNYRNAEVFINNEYKGKTPLVIKNLIPGTYKLRIEKKDFIPVNIQIEPTLGIEYNYQILLRQAQN